MREKKAASIPKDMCFTWNMHVTAITTNAWKKIIKYVWKKWEPADVQKMFDSATIPELWETMPTLKLL